MKYLFTVIRGNVRKSKGSYISFFILLFVVSIALCSVLTDYTNSRKRETDALEEDGFGDMVAALYNVKKLDEINVKSEDVISKIEECDSVSAVERIPAIYTSLYDCNGKSANSSQILISSDNEVLSYNQYDANVRRISKASIGNDEVSVPVSYKGLYNCNIGDVITLGSKENNVKLKVVSYFEDPFMGTSMMGIKTLLVSDETMQKMEQLSTETKEVGAFEASFLVNIHKKDSKMSDLRFEQELNKKSSYASYCWITLSKTQSISYMMMLNNIFSGVLIAFIVVLVVASIIVLSHNISSSIEQDYVNLGILKAVGMTSKDMRLTILIGYMIAAVGGLVAGIPVAIPVVKLINNITLNSSGLYISTRINLPICLAVIAGLLVIIALFVILKTSKIAKITPVMAMSDGNRNVYFSSVMKLPISSKLLNGSLAYRQFVSEKKQYISAIIIGAVLSLFMIMINDMCKWINKEDTISSMFEVTKFNMEAEYKDEDVEKKADEIISKYTSFEKYHVNTTYMLLDNVQTYCYICDAPDQFSTILEGRTCLYDNEILITSYIADGFNVGVGDTINVKKNGKSFDYIISGIYECSNDVGKNFAMNYDGYKKMLDNPGVLQGRTFYRLDNIDVWPEISNELSNNLKKDKDYVAELPDAGESFDIITLSVNGLCVLIYVFSLIFIVITVAIVCGKVFEREKKDYGIYKALGFASGKLRKQMAIRFAIVGAVGALCGIILSLFVGVKMIAYIFSTFGIAHFKSQVGVISAIIPVAFLMIIFALCAYASARKIKKVEPRILITE